MKIILANLTSLLLMCSLAAASPTPVGETEVVPPVHALGVITLESSPDCLDSGLVSEPPSFSFAPEERATLPCGPCSVSACQGLNVGDGCFKNGNYKCVVIYFCGGAPGTGRFCDCSAPY